MRFANRLARASREANSKVILALDVVETNPHRQLRKARRILESASASVCGIKVNRQLVLPCGLEPVSRSIVRTCHRLDLPVIMDAKINDIGHTNEFIARTYFEAGFDAVIASPFVGWHDGLQPVFRLARRLGRGVVLLVYMSHRAASEGYGRTVLDRGRRVEMFQVFAEFAKERKADGVVVGATRPSILQEAKRIVGPKIPVLAPGIGAQGADILKALRSGADYLIVGRTIVDSKNPAASAERIGALTRIRS